MYKKHTVVMLPTNEKVKINHGDLYCDGYNNLCQVDDTKQTRGWGNKKESEIFNGHASFQHTYQHLYLLSDDKINEGDWYIANNTVFKADSEFRSDNSNNPNGNHGSKKIIATTDNSLSFKLVEPHRDKFGDIRHNKFQSTLSQLSQSFLETYVAKYNKGNQIKKVMVEYEGARCYPRTDDDYRLLINKDNTITIKSVKDSWNREEVVDLIKTYRDDIITPVDLLLKDRTNRWIEQNL